MGALNRVWSPLTVPVHYRVALNWLAALLPLVLTDRYYRCVETWACFEEGEFNLQQCIKPNEVSPS